MKKYNELTRKWPDPATDYKISDKEKLAMLKRALSKMIRLLDKKIDTKSNIIPFYGFICNAVGIQFKKWIEMNVPSFRNSKEYVDMHNYAHTFSVKRFMPELFDEISEQGRKIRKDYSEGMAWPLKFGKEKNIEYRIKWLREYINKFERNING